MKHTTASFRFAGIGALLGLAVAGCAPQDSGIGPMDEQGDDAAGTEDDGSPWDDDDGDDDDHHDGDDAGEDDDAPAADDESGDDGEPSGQDHDLINAYVAQLGTLDVAPEALEPGEPDPSVEVGNFLCTTRRPTETKRFDKIVAFAANSGQMWPGAIVGAESIAEGLFTPKILDRAPLTFSASLEGVISGAVSATVDSPSLSAFREAMSTILQQTLTGQTAANIFSQIEEVHSAQQVSFALGVNVQWLLGGIESTLGFDDTTKRSRFVVNFTQSYYTVDVDPPGSAAEFFSPETTVDDAMNEFGEEPPAYVSSVTYGRLVYFVITSQNESSEMRAALEYGFGGAATVDGSVSMTHEEVLGNSEITAYILGGEGDVAAQAVHGIEELRNFINSGGTWTKQSPGAPIAYKLAYLHDDSPARYALTTDYEVEECDRVVQDVRVAVQHLHVANTGDDNGTELEIFGTIAVEDGDGEMYPLWSRDAADFVTIGLGQNWPATGELASAVVPVTPEPGESFVLWVDLYENDSIWGNEDLGQQIVAQEFEDGWRATFPVSAAQGAQHVEVVFDLLPVG